MGGLSLLARGGSLPVCPPDDAVHYRRRSIVFYSSIIVCLFVYFSIYFLSFFISESVLLSTLSFRWRRCYLLPSIYRLLFFYRHRQSILLFQHFFFLIRLLLCPFCFRLFFSLTMVLSIVVVLSSILLSLSIISSSFPSFFPSFLLHLSFLRHCVDFLPSCLLLTMELSIVVGLPSILLSSSPEEHNLVPLTNTYMIQVHS